MVLVVKFARVLQQSQKVFNSAINVQSNLRQFSVSALLKAERRYTEKHEWVSVDGNTGSVGISKYAQEALGDVVFAQLPEPGTVFKQGDECGALESVKAASEVYSPVSGEVTEKNTKVEDTPGLINSHTYTDGWLFKIKLSNKSEVDKLMTEDQYNKYLEESDH
uniref:Glycine cleavage system H protein n=1 Tax=Stomoxys calcitrans TaxID=35570 RepID=A0A1I8NYC4_STOCA